MKLPARASGRSAVAQCPTITSPGCARYPMEWDRLPGLAGAIVVTYTPRSNVPYLDAWDGTYRFKSLPADRY
jgi:hypothetical protein